MRPILLKFQAFGPYKEEEQIDFRELSTKELFLICGETGSGKTMILDAITFALYGCSSGHMRDDLKSLRCKFTSWGIDTFVCFDFEANGIYYRFERRLNCKRSNLSETQNVFIKKNHIFNPIFENGKKNDVTRKAEEIIGLNYNQFCQVIILPQGQFEEFLTSKSENKEKILMNIFGAYKWQKIAEHMYNAIEGKRDELKNLKNKIDTRLLDEDCSSFDDLQNKINQYDEEIRLLDEEYKLADYAGQKLAIEKQKKLAQQFADLHRLSNQISVLEEKKCQFDDMEEQLKRAEKAESFRNIISDFDLAEDNLKKRENRKNELDKELKLAEAFLDEKSKELETYKNEGNQVEEFREKIVTLESKRRLYQRLDILADNVNRLKAEYENEQKKEQELQNESEERKRQVNILNEEYQKLNDEHKLMLDNYIYGITGMLASRLEDGKPCSVCGSVTHPDKAPLYENAPTEEMLDRKKLEVDKKHRELRKAATNQENISRDLEAAKEKSAMANTKYEIAVKEYEEAKANLFSEIHTSEMLENAIDNLKNQVENFKKRLEGCIAARDEADGKFKDVKAKYENAKEDSESARTTYEAKRSELKNKMEHMGYSDVEAVKMDMKSVDEQNTKRNKLAAYKAELTSYREQLKEKQREVEDTKAPDTEELKEQELKLQEEENNYTKQLWAKKTEKNRLIKKILEIKTDLKRYEDEWPQVDNDFSFVKTLRGDSGIGLQRYVLGIMFSSVIAAANQMLKKVHGGRYQLYCTNEKVQGSNKRGLDLKVHDNYSESEEGRNVQTLSGGEKFLTSLALSIGMSTVARQSGIHIDAMFIDEGFGSLDNNSIEDALDILSGIRQSNGMVGIISHVQILQDNIPCKLEVKKSRSGSTIKYVLG